ncbi:MAG: single-stranded DNA-binding protein [bacterium]|nr:single-stranded DNA-binding protein [bacterium]
MANRRSLNRVILIGNVGRDPEITHIPSLDRDVAKFSIATTEVFMDKSTNQFQDVTEWHNIVAWGWAAKKVERSVSRGSMVLVEGKIKTRKWKDKNDQDRWSTEIHADTVTPLDRSNREGSGGYGGGPGMGQGQGQNQGQGQGQGQSQGQDQQDYGYGQGTPNNMGNNNFSQSSAPQAPPEVQINDINDIPYDDSDPF